MFKSNFSMATFEKVYNIDLDNDDMTEISPIADTKSAAAVDEVGGRKSFLRKFATKCMCIKNISDYMWVQKFLSSLPVLPLTSSATSIAPTPLLYLASHEVPGVIQEHVYEKKITKATVSYEDGAHYILVDIRTPCVYDWFQIGEIAITFPAEAVVGDDISLRYRISRSVDGKETPSDGTYTGDIPNCGVQKIGHNHYKISDNFWRFRRAEADATCDYRLKLTAKTLNILPLTISVKNVSATLSPEYLKVCADMFGKIKLTYTKDYIELTKYDGNEVLRHDIAATS